LFHFRNAAPLPFVDFITPLNNGLLLNPRSEYLLNFLVVLALLLASVIVCPTLIKFGLEMLLSCCSFLTVVLYFAAIPLNVSPDLTLCVLGLVTVLFGLDGVLGGFLTVVALPSVKYSSGLLLIILFKSKLPAYPNNLPCSVY